VSISAWPSIKPQVPNGPCPRISIVTPNFNYADLIETTIQSVLTQQYPNLEYIIIDGGSTDESVRIIRKYESSLAYFDYQPNLGQYQTINEGFSKASGEILGWINSDDIYLPWTLWAVAAIFDQLPEVDWIVGRPTIIQNGVIHYVQRHRPFPRDLIRAGMFFEGAGGFGWIQQESCFWRRQLWEKAGPLRTELRYAADFELWTRFADHADLVSVSTVLGGFSFRARQNRGMVHRNQYLDETMRVISERRKANSRESQVARSVARYTKIKKLVGSAIGKRLFVSDLFHGPIIRWNFENSKYEIRRAPFVDLPE